MAFVLDSFNVFSLLACVIALLWWHIQSSLSYWRKLNVKFLKPIPFFGNTAAFSLGRATLHDTIDRLYKQLDEEPFGGFYQKHDPLLMVKDPKLVSAVLITNFQHFHDRGQITSMLSKNRKLNPLNTNLFSTTGERWRIMRRKLTPFFSSGQQKLMYDQINFCSKMLIERMEKHTDDGTGSTCTPTQNLSCKFMIDVIGTCAFGIECPSLTSNDTFPRMCKEAMTLRFPTIGRLILSLIGPRLFDSLNIRIMKKEASDFIMNMILHTINHRRQSGLVRKDILHLLLQFQNSHVDPKFAVEGNNSVLLKEKFDEIDIAAHSFGFFFAGFENTSSTLNFCLYELALNQDIQKKLRSEIQQIKDEHKILNYDSLKEMTYLDAVIAETLRKYPIVVFLHRKCTEDYVIPETNVRIPAGTKIIIPVWSIHHDWRYYPNPQVFDPERFMGDNKRKRSSSLYLPFGDGPRNCSARRFVHMVMKMALSAMILKYDVRPCAKTEVPLTFSKSSNVLRPNAEIQINLSRRIM